MSETQGYFMNDKFKLTIVSQEMRMSHWVDTPVITNTQTQEIVLDLSKTTWHLLQWEENTAELVLTLAKYPDPKDVKKVYCNFEKMLIRIGDLEMPFLELSSILNK